MAKDLVIPIVFPDYLIAVNTPEVKIEVPDYLPWFDVLPENVTVPKTKNKVPELGHAGVLFINGNTGTTKYYEYGRYDPQALGLVRRVIIPDVKIGDDGRPTSDSMKKTLHVISQKAGQSGRIWAVYIEVENKYDAMHKYAKERELQNKNPKREPYDLFTNSCVHFTKGVTEAAGVDTPWMLDPRPNSYIGEFRDDFPDLTYRPKGRSLDIEGIGQF
jgi:hypothetical protein